MQTDAFGRLFDIDAPETVRCTACDARAERLSSAWQGEGGAYHNYRCRAEGYPAGGTIVEHEDDDNHRVGPVFGDRDLSEAHLRACRSFGFADVGYGTQQTGRNTEEVERLASEAKEVLNGYFREFATANEVTTGWDRTCNCDTDETEAGIVLDPFAGTGTACRVAKRLGRRFVGIELNEEYVALAQQRAGIDVDDPDLLTDNGQRGLAAFTDGGEQR